MKRSLQFFVYVLLFLITSFGISHAQFEIPGGPGKGFYGVTIEFINIAIAGDGFIYDGELKLNNELVFNIPEIRNAPYTTTGTLQVAANIGSVHMLFTGRGSHDATFYSFHTIPWNRGTMCEPFVVSFFSLDGSSITAVITITPFGAQPMRIASATDVCEFDEITFDVPADYDWYEWRYQDSSSPDWQEFYNPQAEVHSITFTIADVYGPSYENKLGNGNNVNFRMKIGSCTPVLWPNYTFFRQSPVIKDSDSINPLCRNGTGSYSINSFNRLTVSGEEFQVIVQNMDDPLHSYTSSMITSSELPIEIKGIPSGRYRAYAVPFVNGDPSPCGEVIYDYFSIKNADTLTASVTTSAVNCFNTPTGSINVQANGGSGSGYSYSIDNGNTFQASGVFLNLLPKSYQIIVKDDFNCASVMSVREVLNVTQISEPNLVVKQYNDEDIPCAGGSGGSIVVTGVTGGTPGFNGYQYSYNNLSFQDSPEFTGLVAGSYTFSVKDSKGCMRTKAPIILIDPAPIIANVSSVSAKCHGESNGKVTVVAFGGTKGLKYSLDGIRYQSSQIFSDLLASNYTVSIRDSNACIVTKSIVVSQPPAIEVIGTPTLITCAGDSDGKIFTSVTHGVLPLSFSINNVDFFSSPEFIDLEIGSYTVTVKDKNACIGTSSSILVTSNPMITGKITVQAPISCHGSLDGTLKAGAEGGVSPYSYQWSTAETTEIVSNLSKGEYTVTITDSNDCSKTIAYTFQEPEAITFSHDLTDYHGYGVQCYGANNGSIDLSVNGGNGGYSYNWSNGATTQDINNIVAGSYNVMVKDNKDCSGYEEITLIQPPEIYSSISAQNIRCYGANDGEINFTTTGGVGNYQYSINNGNSWQATSHFSGLAPSNYSTRVRDENNCEVSGMQPVSSPEAIDIRFDTIINTTCNQSNGSVQAMVTGGTSAYSYAWMNGINVLGNNSSITNLSAGIYKIIVTDQNGCVEDQEVPITSSDGPEITEYNVLGASCSDTADGEASINITGGTSPYVINWPDGQATQRAVDLTGGEYMVEVRDQTNCLAIHKIVIPSPDDLVIQTLSRKDPKCHGAADGLITVAGMGGNAGYTYVWNTAQTATTLDNLTAGTYAVTIRDVKNCETTEVFNLIDPPIFTIDIGVDETICEGMSIIKSSPANGSYIWSSPNGFASVNQIVTLTEEGVYTLSVVNSNGCEAKDSFSVSYDENLLKADFLMTSQAHAGDTIVLIDISWPLPDQVSWNYDVGATVIQETKDYAMVRYDATGYYLINLVAKLAACSNEYVQGITILEAMEEGKQTNNQTARLISEVNAHPNPSPESVLVNVNLSSSNSITLELYQAESNKRVYQEELTAEQGHTKAINLSMLPRGMYVLHVRAGKEIKIIKILKE